jgi:tRNA threonylcarbamoyladenosine biosynthesis protein TsaB
MALILNIDTAVETASVCLSDNAGILDVQVNNDRQTQVSWLHPAIQKMISGQGFKITAIAAIAVTIGPGSYTGLRVGLSAAKGFCYALNIPLITINTLEVMADSVTNVNEGLICPMIDARRNEVFTAVYTRDLEEVIQPCAMVINKNSFDNLLISSKITFTGTGIKKTRLSIIHPHAIFEDKTITAANMTRLSLKYFQQKRFSDVAYTEPLYLKEFYSPPH